MPDIKAITAKTAASLRDMAESISIIHSEKGMEPFKKPLLVSLSVVLGIYYLLYSPGQARLASRKFELEKWRLIQTHYDEYASADGKIREYQSRLPRFSDKEEWLSRLINSTSVKYGMAVDSLSPQTENEAGNYLLVSREVSLTTTYSQFGKWLADIESTPAFLRVSEVSISKVEDPPRYVRVNVKLSTVFRKEDGTASMG